MRHYIIFWANIQEGKAKTHWKAVRSYLPPKELAKEQSGLCGYNIADIIDITDSYNPISVMEK